MVDKVKVVPLDTKYLESAADLYALGTEFATTTMPHMPREACLAALTAQDAVFWLYVVDGKIAGLGGMEKIRFIDRVVEPTINVHPDFRHRGLGYYIAQHLFEMAQDFNVRRVQTVILETSPSRQFLIDLGFKQEGVLKGLRLVRGKPVDGLLYAWVGEQ